MLTNTEVLSPTRYLLFVGILFLFCQHAQAQDILRVDPSLRHQPIGKNTEFFIDDSRAITLDQILKGDLSKSFVKSREATLNFGPTKSICWIRFRYTSPDSLVRFLAIGNTNLSTLDVYVCDGKKILKSIKSGLNSGPGDQGLNLNSWLFELPIARPNIYDVYIRVADARRVIVPLEITLLNQEISESHREDFLFGLYFGCLAIIVILNFYFFSYFRERIYVFYGGHIACQIVINAILQGYLFTLFGSSLFVLSRYVPAIAGLSNIFAILFALAFLDVKTSLEAWYKPTSYLIIIPASNVLLGMLGFYRESAVVSTYVGIIVCIWLFLLGMLAYTRNVMQARFYIVGWGAFFMGILVLNFALNGWIEVNAFTFNAALFGTMFEVLLVSFALADRINLIRIDRELERQQRLSLIEKQNMWLEENVKVRTMELLDKTKEVEGQNEELRQQHEELAATHEQVEKQKHLIEERNKEIEAINQNLESKVKQRTFELEESIKNLLRQNHDLEQFSYIVSHNMRAPVARILGLIQLLATEHHADERSQLMEYLRESAVGLDEIIHDLSQIIDLRRGSDMRMERVDLEKIIQHNLSDLTDEIKRANAYVKLDIQAKQIVTVKGYIQSILHNLLSNAVKYRDPERPLDISVTASETETNFIIEIQDNGLGVNMPADKINEIFHLYKRTHTHVQGKGLGLYLVKTQVEALHGHIEVTSEKGKGSYFRVSIPKSASA